MKTILIPILLLLATTATQAQSQSCTNEAPIFKFEEPSMNYRQNGFSDFQQDSILPLLTKCMNRDKLAPSSLSLFLTISAEGKVIAVESPNIEASPTCKNELFDLLMRSQNWNPGKSEGQAIESQFQWRANCIKWTK